MTRLAVLASHEGTTLQAVIDACAEGAINASVALVISNNSQSGAMRRACAAGVPTLHLSNRTHPDADTLDTATLHALKDAGANWVLLLGYVKKLGPQTLGSFTGHILNTHPALLPKFGGRGFFGRKVHEAVLAAGDAESGATVHLVEAEYDTGPQLAQVRVAVAADDTAETLESRVKKAEQELLVATLAELVSKRQAS